MITHKIGSMGEENAWQSGTRRFFFGQRLTSVSLEFKVGSSLCFYNFFLLKFLRFGENLLLVFERTGDHKIPAKKLGFQIA